MALRTPPASAGILLYRRVRGGIEVLIAHPGGPFWAHRDEGAWSIPKGLIDDGEALEVAARREFMEETGTDVTGDLISLGVVKLRSHKPVHGFAAEGDLDPDAVVCNTFALEWPPKSGRFVDTPEIDRVAWCGPGEAKRLLNPAQAVFIDRLLEALDEG
jgi:predicted NUDIX family NTP pyrophosphohydrolase